MNITNIISRLPRNGTQDTPHTIGSITKIIVHHDAQNRSNNYDSIQRYIAQANYHINGKKEDGLQYHYKIDNVGEVFQCRNLTDTLWHAANYPVNRASIAICLDGDFTQQTPTREQYISLKALLTELCTQHPEFPADKNGVFGHKEVSLTGTACPGSIVTFVRDYRMGGDTVAIPTVAFNDGSMGPVPTEIPQTQNPPVPPPVTPPADVYKGDPIVVEEPKVEPPVISTPPVEVPKETPMESPKFSLNKADLISLAKGFAITLAGAGLTFLAEYLAKVDFGQFAVIAVPVFAFLVNVARKWLAGVK
jgi:hypothetical protein